MNYQQIAEQLKWLAVEVELARPNWSEVLRAGIELIHTARPRAEGQYAEKFRNFCPRCGSGPQK